MPWFDKGVMYATWNGWAWKNGSKHDAAAH